MDDEMQAVIDYLSGLLEGEGIGEYAEAPYDDFAANTPEVDYAQVDPFEVLAQALAQAGVEGEAAEQVMAAATAAASASAGGGAAAAGATATATTGYEAEQLAEIFARGIQIQYEEGDVIHQHIDQSLHVGEAHGDIYQENESVVQNVTGDNSSAIGEDGYGVATGDNATAAGHDVYDHGQEQTIGDNATIVEGSHITGSGVGQGSSGAYDNSYDEAHDYSTNDSYNEETNDSYNTEDSYNEETNDSYDTEDSYNVEASDDDYVAVEVDVDAEANAYDHDEYQYEEAHQPDYHDDDYDG